MSFAKNLRVNIKQSFFALPLILIGWSFFMGCTQGNIGLLVLALGQMTVLPLTSYLSHIVLEFVGKKMEQAGWTGPWGPYITVPNKESCNMIPGAVDLTIPVVNIAPSFWLAQIIFFFSFLLSSGVTVLNMKAEENAAPEKVENRKAQATLSIILSSILLVVLIGTRYFISGCETITGMAVAAAIAAPLGIGWYFLARQCSARDADIFGIIQKILPPSAEEPPAMTCVYTG